MTDVDLDPGCTLNKKIRNAQLAQYNFILGQWEHSFLSLLSFFLSISPALPHRHWFFFPFFIYIFFVSLHVTLLGKVVGEKEKTSNTVNVRTRDNKVHGERSVEECIERLKQLKASRSRNAEEEFWAFLEQLISTKTSTDLKIPRGWDQLLMRGI